VIIGLKILFTNHGSKLTSIENTIIDPSNTLTGTSNTFIDSSNTLTGASNTLIGTANTLIGARNTLIGTDNTLIGADNPLIDIGITLTGTGNTLIGAGNTLIGADNTLVGTGNPVFKTMPSIENSMFPLIFNFPFSINQTCRCLISSMEQNDAVSDGQFTKIYRGRHHFYSAKSRSDDMSVEKMEYTGIACRLLHYIRADIPFGTQGRGWCNLITQIPGLKPVRIPFYLTPA
jgi:hypothetical protein